MRQHAKFREDRLNCSGDMADFRFFKMDSFYACWDHSRRVLGGLCDFAKFGGNRRSNFDSMQILIFCTLSLKIPIHAPKIGVFGGFCSQNGEQYERGLQKAHPWAETRRMTYRSSKSVHFCELGASRRIKQKKFKKVHLRNHNTCFSRVCPDHPRCRSATWIYMCGHTRDPITYSKFHRNPFRGFGAPGVKIWPFPLFWLVAFTTGCTTVQAVILDRS